MGVVGVHADAGLVFSELEALGDDLLEDEAEPSYLQEPTYAAELPAAGTSEPATVSPNTNDGKWARDLH